MQRVCPLSRRRLVFRSQCVSKVNGQYLQNRSGTGLFTPTGISATQGNQASNGGGPCTSREKAAVPILERALGLIQTKVFPAVALQRETEHHFNKAPDSAGPQVCERRQTVYASKPIEFPAQHEIDAREHAPVNRSGLRVTALNPKEKCGIVHAAKHAGTGAGRITFNHPQRISGNIGNVPAFALGAISIRQRDVFIFISISLSLYL